MGEDIHSKVLVYSKIENCLIDGLTFTSCPEDSCFGPMFEGRNYQFFSLFGSQRGDLRELSYGKYGIPKNLSKTYQAYLKDSDYYGYVYWDITSFKKAIDEYSQLMHDPRKYMDYEDSEFDVYDIDERKYDEQMTWIYRYLHKMRQQINYVENDIGFYQLGNILDLNKTTFLFYFDS